MPNREMAVREGRSTESWNPWRELRSLAGMTELFDDVFGGFRPMRMPLLTTEWAPKVNIQETEKEYVISAALPGVKKEDVKISMQDGMLTLSGEYKEDKEEKGNAWLRHEMSYGSFQRSFILPDGVHPEDLKATHKDGILKVTLPKPAPEKSRGINIKVE